MIQVAYDFPLDGIVGPDWFEGQGYDIAATMPAGTSVDDFRLMVRSMLAERFKLVVHRQTKEVSGYDLEVAKGGLKIKEVPVRSKEEAAAFVTERVGEDDGKTPNPKRDEALKYMESRGPGFKNLVTIDKNGFGVPRPGNPVYAPGAGFEVTIVVNGRYRATKLNARMQDIATFLARLVGGPAEDRTGLMGQYDVFLEYVPRPSGVTAGETATAAVGEPGPDVLDAIQGQLGLKLTPKKAPTETLVVDHAERVPTDN